MYGVLEGNSGTSDSVDIGRLSRKVTPKSQATVSTLPIFYKRC